MKEIGIHAIIDILRGLNNSITISRLASDLPVSKSTLDRCNRDNRWPRALIISDIKNVINKYRDLYFDCKDELIAGEILNLLMVQGYPYEIYKNTYSENGYDAFLSELLNDAYINSQQTSEQTDKNILSDIRDDAGEKAEDITIAEDKETLSQGLNHIQETLSGVKFKKYLSTNWLYLFFWIIFFVATSLALKLNNTSISGVYSFILSLNPVLYTLLSLVLAVSIVLAGRLVDTPIALKRYEQRTSKTISRSDRNKMERISLYGDDKKIVYGEGRFNCNKEHVIFAAFCNITSCMWAISIYLYLNTLNNVNTILDESDMNICLSVILILSILVTFIYNYFEQNIPYPEGIQVLSENPDTYIQNRANVVFNNIYLIFVLFFCFSAYVILVYYSLFSGSSKTDSLDFSFILVLISAYLFLWFSSVSPYAVYFGATSAGNFAIIPPMLVVFSLIYAFFNFSYNHNMIVLIVLSIMILLSWGIILYRQNSRKAHGHNKAYKSSMLASLIIIVTVLVIIITEILVIS